jgi:hypothetical protein
MTRKFSDLTKKMSAKDRVEIKTRSTKLLAELPLEQLRSARSLTRGRLPAPKERNRLGLSPRISMVLLGGATL